MTHIWSLFLWYFIYLFLLFLVGWCITTIMKETNDAWCRNDSVTFGDDFGIFCSLRRQCGCHVTTSANIFWPVMISASIIFLEMIPSIGCNPCGLSSNNKNKQEKLRRKSKISCIILKYLIRKINHLIQQMEQLVQ